VEERQEVEAGFGRVRTGATVSVGRGWMHSTTPSLVIVLARTKRRMDGGGGGRGGGIERDDRNRGGRTSKTCTHARQTGPGK
jgi:hypothetical protein